VAFADTAGSRIYLCHSDGRGRWTDPAVASDFTCELDNPSLAAYDGQLYLAWTHRQNVYWSRATPGGAWAKAQMLDPSATPWAPSIAVAGNQLYLAWAEGHEPYHVWYSRFQPATATWTRQEWIDFSSSWPPQLACWG